MAGTAPAVAAPRPPRRVISLVVLVACAIAPGLVAISEGAPLWALSGVLPLVAALVVLAHDHDYHIHQAAHRLVAIERERARLAESVKHVGRAFGSGLDLPALADVMARTASDALDARRSLVRVPGHDSHGGPADASLDTLLELVASSAADGGSATTVLRSTSGHHAMAHPLRDGAGVLAVARSARAFTEEQQGLLAWLAGQAAVSVENVALHERLREQAHVDELTGLGNQRAFHETLHRELSLARRTGVPVGLVLLDLDDFKRVNDTYGHPVGDRVLADVGGVLAAAVRSTDTVTRWGGEEFAVVLPHTDLQGAAVAAESIRAAIGRMRVPLPGGGELEVTASLGVASAPRCSRDPDGLYAVADHALYDAKQSGKDRVGVAAPGAHATVVA